MEIINRATKDLVPYSMNAKVHPEEQIANVANSIRRFGWQQPIVVDDNNVVVIGHCRLLAAKRLGLREVPVTVASGLTDEEIRELRIADNKTNESAWDFEMLDRDRAGLAFDGFAFDWMQASDGGEEPPEPEAVEDNFDPDEDVPEESDIKLGDVFILGRHRLMCGDSTDSDDVLTLMGGEKVDLFLTDPPYNIDYKYKQENLAQFRTNKRVANGNVEIANDAMSNGEFMDFLLHAFSSANKVMRPGCAFYVWHADLYGHIFRQAVIDTGWNLKQVLIWVKNRFTLSRQDYHYRHEPVLYGWKDGAAHYFIDSRKNDTVFDDAIDIKKLSKQEMAALLEEVFSDKVPTTVLYEDRPFFNDIHPTMKPIKLMARLVANSSKLGWNVLDLFGGSGSTMMACEQLGRNCYTMELEPCYVQAIIQRWYHFTGEQVYKVDNGQRIPYEVI
jgi:site-specific DNA-methyltransferase (adenine-specific)